MTHIIVLSILLLVSGVDDISKISRANKAKAEAESFYKTGKFKDAAQKYRYLIDTLKVSDDNIALNLAHSLYKSEDKSAAEKVYSSLYQSSNPSIRSIAQLQNGNVAALEGKTDDALKLFKNALKSDPSNASSKRTIKTKTSKKIRTKRKTKTKRKISKKMRIRKIKRMVKTKRMIRGKMVRTTKGRMEKTIKTEKERTERTKKIKMARTKKMMPSPKEIKIMTEKTRREKMERMEKIPTKKEMRRVISQMTKRGMKINPTTNEPTNLKKNRKMMAKRKDRPAEIRITRKGIKTPCKWMWEDCNR
jgi:tetratricopeptide (TPR) repeat protein